MDPPAGFVNMEYFLIKIRRTQFMWFSITANIR